MPVCGQHRVDDCIEVTVANPLGLAQRPLLSERQALRYRTATLILGCDANLNPVQHPHAQRVVNKLPDGVGHYSPALELGTKPIAEAGRAILPIHAEEADHPRYVSVNDDGGLKTVVPGRLGFRFADESKRILEGLGSGPWQPP